MRSHLVTKAPDSSNEITDIVRLWLLRTLVPLGGHKKFVRSRGFSDDDLAEALGLGKWIDAEKFDQRLVRSELRKLHRSAEKKAHIAKVSDVLSSNIGRLVELVGLNEVDVAILTFVVQLSTSTPLEFAIEALGPMSSAKVSRNR